MATVKTGENDKFELHSTVYSIDHSRTKVASFLFFPQYGPGGVFYKMSKTCLTTKYDKYEYTACLFVSVKQQAFPQPSTQIGKRPHWVSQGGETGYVLEMGAGDTSGCPGGQSRRSLVNNYLFIAGISYFSYREQ